MLQLPVVLVLIAAFAAAQTLAPSPPPNTDAGQKIRVEGTILSVNGDLLRKASVRLQGTPSQPGQPPLSYAETTDNSGKFLFDDVAPGHYTLSAE